MKNQQESDFRHQAHHLGILEKISGLWSDKSTPQIPCFHIGRHVDEYYRHTFLDDNGQVNSESVLLFTNPQLQILIPDYNQIFTYNNQNDELFSEGKVFVRSEYIEKTESHLWKDLSNILLVPDDPTEKKMQSSTVRLY